jgi:acyl-CoA thioesterase-2
MEKVSELLKILTLEKIEERIFRGQNYKTPWGRVFGGQVLAQAIQSAIHTVADDRYLHSMHGYFLRPGDINVPIVYDVDVLRDGGSFSTRRIIAIQKGRPIFNMAASFHSLDDNPLEHQMEMPKVPKPEGLKTSEQLLEHLKKDNPFMYKMLFNPKPIEFRPVEVIDPMERTDHKPIRNIWFKVKEPLSDDRKLHQVIVAYISDYNLMTTAALPNRSKMSPGSHFFASLDHAMWFHRDFRADEWLLYSLDSPSSSNSRGLGRGKIFTKDGTLVSSTIQEGLMAPIRT